MPSVPVTVTVQIPERRIRDLLCAGFEGGVGYWCCIDEARHPEGTSHKDFCEGGKYSEPDGSSYFHWSQTVPMMKGGMLLLSDATGDDDHLNKKGERLLRWTLNRSKVEQGLQRMAKKYPRHFGDFMNENEDADTGDVFIQCCVFGDVVYG